MKGQHLVIGLVLFVIAIVAAIYFTMTATFKNHDNGMEPIIEIVEEKRVAG